LVANITHATKAETNPANRNSITHSTKKILISL
jgi:hypothetical protein